jgi:hypothetical protein
MTPPHFQDLINPSDYNYILPSSTHHGSSDNSGKSSLPHISSSIVALHTYADTAGKDAAVDSVDNWEDGL